VTGSIEEDPTFPAGSAAFRPSTSEPPVRAEERMNSRLFMGTFSKLQKE
jgi:hypothetical protein